MLKSDTSQTYIQKVNKLEERCSNSDTSQTYIQKVNKLEEHTESQ